VLQRLAAPRPRFRPVWSEWIIAETWRVLAWRWLADHGRADQEGLARAANRMLRRLLRVMHLVSVRAFVGPAPWPGLRDEDDAPIWATAVAAGARYVVSHNTDDFPPLVQGRHVYAGIEYLTAIEFVEDVLGEDAAQILGAPLPRSGVVRSGRTAPAQQLGPQ
jgi:PIN domain